MRIQKHIFLCLIGLTLSVFQLNAIAAGRSKHTLCPQGNDGIRLLDQESRIAKPTLRIGPADAEIDMWMHNRPLTLESEVSQLVEEMSKTRWDSRKSKPYVEITELTELPGVYLAIFNFQRYMNIALDRASRFIEDGGEITPHDEHINGDRNRWVGGHDMVGEKMLEYWREYEKQRPTLSPPSNPKDQKLVQMELDFWNHFVVPRMSEKPKAVILGASIDGDVHGVVSHEALHAQYFTSDVMQNVVKDFWNNTLTEADRASVRKALTRAYDENNTELMINEFQAYLLMPGGEYAQLAHLVPRYRQALVDALTKAGVPPVQFNVKPTRFPLLASRATLDLSPKSVQSGAWVNRLKISFPHAISTSEKPSFQYKLSGFKEDAFPKARDISLQTSIGRKKLSQAGGIIDPQRVSLLTLNQSVPVSDILNEKIRRLVGQPDVSPRSQLGKSANSFSAVLYAHDLVKTPGFQTESHFRQAIRSKFNQIDPRLETLQTGDVLVAVDTATGEWKQATYYLFQTMGFTKADPGAETRFSVQPLDEMIQRLYRVGKSPDRGMTLIAFRKKPRN